MALKAAEIAGTRLWRQFGYISIVLTISIAYGLYAYVQTEIDNAIEKEVANYLETQGGEQVTRSIRSNVDFVKDSISRINQDLQSIDEKSRTYANQITEIKSLMSDLPLSVGRRSITLRGEGGALIGLEWGQTRRHTYKTEWMFELLSRKNSAIKSDFELKYASAPDVFLAGGVFVSEGRDESGYILDIKVDSFSIKNFGSRLSRKLYENDGVIGWFAIGELQPDLATTQIISPEVDEL